MEEKVYPIPEVLKKGPWDIQGGAKPRTIDGTMVVPLTSDIHDMVARTHELAHAKWTPMDPAQIPADVNPEILSAVEDLRVNRKALNAGAVLDPGFDPTITQATVESLVRRNDLEGLGLLWLSHADLESGRIVQEAMAKHVPPRVREAILAANNAINAGSNFGSTIGVARILQRTLQRIREHEENLRNAESRSQLSRTGAASGMELAHQEAERKMRQDLAEGKSGSASLHTMLEMQGAKIDSEGNVVLGAGKPRYAVGYQPWGRVLAVEEPERPNRLPGRLGRRMRPSDVGTALVYPQRYMQDGKVFGRKLRSHGATVLVDGSGSMRLSHEQIYEILLAAPGATVYIYGSRSGNGKLKLLAKNGTYVDTKDVASPGGENCIDYPALLYISKMDEPRIWVSDGFVTGASEQFSPENYVECEQLCMRARILRIPTTEEAVKHLQKIQKIRLGVFEAA